VLATKVYYPMSDDPNDRGLSAQAHRGPRSTGRWRGWGTDYVDLYVIHAFDADTPVEETMEALHDTVRDGKVRYLGASHDVCVAVSEDEPRGGDERLDTIRQHAVPIQTCSTGRKSGEMFPLLPGSGASPSRTFSPLARGFLARDAGTARTTHDIYQDFYGDDIDREK